MAVRNETLAYRRHLESLAARLEHPECGFFGPGSMAWRVNREGVLALGALRALLMQVAHPKVAQGVVDHSDYRRRPMARVYNTLQSQQLIVFGTCEEAIEVLVRIYTRHTAVQGKLPAGFSAEGSREYHATDQRLLMWVYATLVDSAIRTYNNYLPPLSLAEQEAFYRDSRWYAQLMGIREAHLPPTLEDFNRWMADVLASGEITVTPSAQEIAAMLLRLPLPIFWPAHYLLAAGSLPSKLRQAFGLKWTPPIRALYNAGLSAVRAAASRLPLRLRTTPPYWRALKRCGERSNGHEPR